MRFTALPAASAAAILSLSASATFACATCGCSLNSDGALGYTDATGWRVSFQYDYIDQDQLRSGYHAFSAAQAAAINDTGGNQEVEHRTINRTATVGVGYRSSADWGFNLLIPYVDRDHSTYGSAGSNQLTPDNLSSASSSGLGDIKFITSYQGFLPTHNFGVQLGIKLPTGRYGGQSNSGATVGHNPVLFNSGPNAGQALDTSLNPGTGSTDLIAGAYYNQPVSQDFDLYINGQFQAAVAEKLDQPGADYRPGNQTNLSLGTRYEANSQWQPQLQINLTHKSADQGALADTTDTAGTVAYLSPGVTVNLPAHTQLYAFVQVPFYSKLDGIQLFPRWTGSVGINYAF